MKLCSQSEGTLPLRMIAAARSQIMEVPVSPAALRFFCHLFVCVEVLRPSQPNWVMSGAVSLPNHTFTGQA